jgi:glycosyltransferase involved in cell wall biosynthesis
LVRAIDRMAENEAERCKLAQGALARSAEFTWTNKAKIINDIYNQVLSR